MKGKKGEKGDGSVFIFFYFSLVEITIIERGKGGAHEGKKGKKEKRGRFCFFSLKKKKGDGSVFFLLADIFEKGKKGDGSVFFLLADIFEVLFQHNVISRKLTEKMIQMAGFRNRIVHEYEKIDLEIVHTVWRKNLDDIEGFCKTVVLKYNL